MSSKRWRLRIAFGVLGVLLVGWAGLNYVRVYCCADPFAAQRRRGLPVAFADGEKYLR